MALIAPTGPDIAQAIRAGHADCGIATRAVATAAGLDFVPLVTERFDLLMRQRDSYRGPLSDVPRIASLTGVRDQSRRTRWPRCHRCRQNPVGAMSAIWARKAELIGFLMTR